MKMCEAMNTSKPNTINDPGYAAEDGITHINIHPTIAKTELGKQLALFSYTPFIHPYYGKFNCLEGFWHFVRNEERDDKLRYATYDRALKLGKKGKMDSYPGFKEDILGAMYQKIIQNKEIRDAFVESTLPFDMYYLFGPHDIQIATKWGSWMLAGLTEIRESLKKDQVPEVWIRAEERYARGDLRR